MTSNGISTGDCDRNAEGVMMCEISGWCPVEDEKDEENILLQDVNIILIDKKAANFSIFIRADGIFPSKAATPITTASDNALIWNYNLFYLSDLVAFSRGYPIPSPSKELPARAPISYYNNIQKKGDIIQVYVTFDCELWKNLKEYLNLYIY